MDDGKRHLADLVNMESPQAVYDEVRHIVSLIHPGFPLPLLDTVFRDTVRLFRGRYPGYRACTTEYHNLKHTTDVLIALARIMHGASLKKAPLSEEGVFLGLLSALLHDSGYIQAADDRKGTGAKYTLIHVERSVAFAEAYCARKRYPAGYAEKCTSMIRCTNLNTPVGEIPFLSEEVELVGRMLGAADLVGQMADRVYLEKLLFLFYEFKEGLLKGYSSERDLLQKTLTFYEHTKSRLDSDLGGIHRYLRHHFRERWGMDKDLYARAIESNIKHLRFILDDSGKDHRSHLQRGGIVKRLGRKPPSSG
ncbi:MAG: hypothetical protein K8I29_13170 [Alphaproteobacteria bacterium]|uniref:HD/PDEase domain-containing protein n=1 Tax=Candidatus Nitrobium versatile TaxID=2884831 RepID=A0A953JEK6_9BACT|nr:hypothetical protein [Candidatus Nitrobium versatile]